MEKTEERNPTPFDSMTPEQIQEVISGKKYAGSNRPGPGTELQRLIGKWIAEIPANNPKCSCKWLTVEMNKHGVKWCRENRDSIIVPKMLENREALRDDLKNQSGIKYLTAQFLNLAPEIFLREGAKALVDTACNNAESRKEFGMKSLRETSPNRRRARRIRNHRRKGKGDPPDKLEFTKPPKTNLVFHCYPQGDWERHIEKIAPVKDQFDRRILGVATDNKSASVKEVKKAFGDGWEIVTVKNLGNSKRRTGLREVATYNRILPMIASEDHNEVTFACHGKGSQDHTMNEIIRWWTDAMYETIVYNREEVFQKMAEGYSVVGSFRKLGGFSTRHGWHFSGTFYAFRHALTFTKSKFPRYRQIWFGTEAWPGDWFRWNEAACIIGDNCGDLYKAQNQPRQELEAWRLQRAKG